MYIEYFEYYTTVDLFINIKLTVQIYKNIVITTSTSMHNYI